MIRIKAGDVVRMAEGLRVKKGRTSTNAVDTASLARHRWYPIKEGFSPSLVIDAYREMEGAGCGRVKAIDPFSGSGTTPVECARLGIGCFAFEVNPFLAFVGRTKLRQADPGKLRAQRKTVLKGLRRPVLSPLESVSTFCEAPGREKWLFNRNVLRAFAGGWKETANCPPAHRPFFRLALLRAAMDNCNAYPEGKCLRYKRLESFDCFDADSVIERFENYCSFIEEDLESTPLRSGLSSVECADAREMAAHVAGRRFDLCVTSPPYLNSFDYSDVYRPELFLGGYVSNNRALMRIRLRTLRSHIQADWPAPVKSNFGAMYAKVLKEIMDRRETLWSPRIPRMIQAYFEDMDRLLAALATRANPGALLKIVVGTSAYGGVVVPVDFILAEIAEQAGWELRDVQVVRRLRTAAQSRSHGNREASGLELRESILILKFPGSRAPRRSGLSGPIGEGEGRAG